MCYGWGFVGAIVCSQANTTGAPLCSDKLVSQQLRIYRKTEQYKHSFEILFLAT